MTIGAQPAMPVGRDGTRGRPGLRLALLAISTAIALAVTSAAIGLTAFALLVRGPG